MHFIISNAMNSCQIIRGLSENGAGTSPFPDLLGQLDLHKTRRLDNNFKGEVVELIQETYPELQDPLKLQAFINRWRYMFAYAAVGYARAYTSLMCWTFTRPVNLTGLFCATFTEPGTSGERIGKLCLDDVCSC
jgi:hypothetical protein